MDGPSHGRPTRSEDGAGTAPASQEGVAGGRPPSTSDAPGQPGSLDPVDAALAAALGVPDVEAGHDELVTIDELAEDAEVPVAVLEAIEREGLLVARSGAVATGDARFAAADAPTVRAAMQMLETGLPLAEFLDLARRADRQLRDLADEAVEAFLLYVRDPVRGTRGSSPEAADALVEAFQRMLPATRDLVGGHFQALVVAAARARLAAVVDDAR